MFAVVEVAATVRTERTSAEVVPTAVLSVRVWSRTRVPSSCHPETLEAVIPWQMMLPDESVVKALEPLQVAMVEILSPPATTSSPRRVLVALVFVCNMFPPEIVSPEAEERPPMVSTLIPPAKVEVAVPDALI